MKIRHVLFIAIVGFVAYSNLSQKDDSNQENQLVDVEVDQRVGEICKATSAMTFGREYSIMKLDSVDTNGIAYVHYNRPSDNTSWAIKCKLDGNRVLWASNNPDSIGRWRDDPADEVITYSLSEGNVKLNQVYSDGSSEDKIYKVE